MVDAEASTAWASILGAPRSEFGLTGADSQPARVDTLGHITPASEGGHAGPRLLQLLSALGVVSSPPGATAAGTFGLHFESKQFGGTSPCEYLNFKQQVRMSKPRVRRAAGHVALLSMRTSNRKPISQRRVHANFH
jgi:hypothetical protein